MEDDHSFGAHRKNAEAEIDQTGKSPALRGGDVTCESGTAQASNQAADVANEVQDNPSPSPIPIPSTAGPDLDLPPRDCGDDAAIPLRMTASIPADNGYSNVEPDTGHILDLLDDQLREQYAPSWSVNHAGNEPIEGYSQDWLGSPVESDDNNIQAFAKLEFADGDFYMNTYALEIGRDVQASRDAEALDRKIESRMGMRLKKHNSTRSRSSQSDVAGGESSAARSITSKDGGPVANHEGSAENVIDENEDSNGHREGSPKKGKSRRRKSQSPNSSSKDSSRKSSAHTSSPGRDYNTIAMECFMEQQSSLSSRVDAFTNSKTMPPPPPDITPLLKIHPKVNDFTSHKAVSRRHARIFFDFDKDIFQIEFLGVNGGFVGRQGEELQHHKKGEVISLHSGWIIQIGGLDIKFVLPNVALRDTGADQSPALESPSGDTIVSDAVGSDREDSQEEARQADEEPEIEDARSESEPQVTRTRRGRKKKIEAPPPALPKRKGPGRPPKNGICSKREQKLLAKQAKEEAKAKGKAEGEGRVLAPPKQTPVKEGKDTNTAEAVESSLQPNGKRKYTKRKRAGGTEDQKAVRESTEHTEPAPPEQMQAASLPPKPVKEKRPAKPPRSPSPVYDKSKMTPEQLAKPTHSYVVLIHEALSNSNSGQMSLPQIYRAIERRYPYYKLGVSTLGWQSSVRHNLSQHPAFRKIERDGKGWMWGLVPDISIEKEKKRRTPPPPATQQNYYPRNQMVQHPYPYSGMPPQNGNVPPHPYGAYPGMPTSGMPYPPPQHLGIHLPLVNAQSESTYRSPYESNPPPAPSQSKPEQQPDAITNGVNGNHPTSTPASHPEKSDTNPPNINNNTQNRSLPLTFPPAPPSSKPKSHPNDLNEAVNKFKTALINTMEDKVQAEAMVNSAINRVLAIQNKANCPPGEENPNEKPIADAFKNMLGELSHKNRGASNDQRAPVAPMMRSGAGEAEAGPSNTSKGVNGTAAAAEKAAQIALANGEVVSSATQEGQEKGKLQEPKDGVKHHKRPLENGNANHIDDESRPAPKRVASSNLKS
ncbi:hypothetical protein ACLMJK_000431 [Lecanora helva]